jgi:hypothetical protein
MWFRWGFSYFTTRPYRFNRNLKAAVYILHNSLQTTWDESLPYFTLAFNTAWHESRKLTPAKLFLGQDLLDPLDLLWKVTEVLGDPSGPSLQEVWEEALNNFRRARRNLARRFFEGRSPNPLSQETRCWLNLILWIPLWIKPQWSWCWGGLNLWW